jgi:tetratricopeptide (TPR) repeat protein
MGTQRRTGSGQKAEFLNNRAGAIRISFEHEVPAARTALEVVKERLLRPGFLVALIVTVGVAAVSVLTGFPLPTGRATVNSPALLSDAGPSPSTTTARASEARAAAAAEPPATEHRFLDSDDSGRLAYRNGQLEEALVRFQTAVERNPSDAESMNNAAQVLVRLGRAGEAVPLLRRAIGLNGNRWAYRFNLARALDQQGQLDQALEQYEVAAALFPDDYATLFNLGRTYHRQGNETAAIERYRRAIALNPGEPTFHFAMALSLEKQGRAGDAAASYARFLELAPDSPDAARVRTRITELQADEGADPATPVAEKTPIR